MWRYVVLLVVVSCCSSLRIVSASFQTLVPQPLSIQNGTGSVQISSGFSFALDKSCAQTKFLNDAFESNAAFIFWNGQPAKTTALDTCSVCLASNDTSLKYGTDESYSISVSADGKCLIGANTVFGALYALETFTQLTEYAESESCTTLRTRDSCAASTGSYHVAGLPLTITDKPRFAWRGMLIDSARHFLPVSTLLRVIDSMVYSKLNVLHWHIVDAIAFPFESSTYPKLSDAAWHPRATFNSSEVAQVVAYGASHGVRVMPEFDVPGHAASWNGAGAYNTTTNCPTLAKNINNVNLSPVGADTWDLLKGLFKEVVNTFSDDFVHIGGDEVVQSCWSEDPLVVAYMNANSMTTLDVYQQFVDFVTNTVTGLGKKVINWDDCWGSGVHISKDTVIEVWHKDDTLQQVVEAGYEAIYAGSYYLDQQQPNETNTYYQFQETWQDFYGADPTRGMTESQAQLVLGGELCLWAETVTPNIIMAYLWPRAFAGAERFWSAQNVTDVDDATNRLEAHACRLYRRGLNIGTFQPDFCLTADF